MCASEEWLPWLPCCPPDPQCLVQGLARGEYSISTSGMDDWVTALTQLKSLWLQAGQIMATVTGHGVVHSPTQPVTHLCTVFSQGGIASLPPSSGTLLGVTVPVTTN